MSVQITVCFSEKSMPMRKKHLECGQSRFIKVVTEDGEKVTTEVAQK
jgi:hypothetical protein